MSETPIIGQPSDRNHHRAKVTIYLTPDELLAIDGTMLELRRRYGIKVDRGRFVREALATSSLHKVAERLRGRM